jgi:hypothetical protein
MWVVPWQRGSGCEWVMWACGPRGREWQHGSPQACAALVHVCLSWLRCIWPWPSFTAKNR